jgi:chromosome segregation ATPase
MAEMTESEKLAYGLITTAGREDEFKKRIDELVERRQAAEEAEAKITTERDALHKLREDTNLEVARKTAALNAAQKEHDEVADEAHKRIQLALVQTVELGKLKDDLDHRERNIASREQALVEGLHRQDAQAKMLGAAVNGVKGLKDALDEVRRKAQAITEALG